MIEGGLSERAKFRLRLAAGFLRNGFPRQGTFDPNVPRAEFYDAVQHAIACLSDAERAELKELVDWQDPAAP